MLCDLQNTLGEDSIPSEGRHYDSLEAEVVFSRLEPCSGPRSNQPDLH